MIAIICSFLALLGFIIDVKYEELIVNFLYNAAIFASGIGACIGSANVTRRFKARAERRRKLKDD